jgi:hypothetical protein
VRPALVVEVEFLEWMEDGSIRHPTFCGFRSDIGLGRKGSKWGCIVFSDSKEGVN